MAKSLDRYEVGVWASAGSHLINFQQAGEVVAQDFYAASEVRDIRRYFAEFFDIKNPTRSSAPGSPDTDGASHEGPGLWLGRTTHVHIELAILPDPARISRP